MRRKCFSMSIIIILLTALIPLPGTAGPVTTEQQAAESQNSAIPQRPAANGFSRQSPYAGTEKGLRHWVYQSGLHTASTPVIDPNGTAYFTAGKDLIAVDRTGKKLWSWRSAVALTNSPELGSDGKIFITSEAGDLFALDSTGSESWTFRHTPPETYNITNVTARSCSSCSVGPDGTIFYMVCYNSLETYEVILYAINPNGSIKWSTSSSKKSLQACKPVVSNDGTVFFGYTQEVPSSVRARFGLIVMTTTYATVAAYESNGKLLWEQKILCNNLTSTAPLCPSNENGVFIGLENALYSINSSGNTIKLFECNDLFSDTNGVASANSKQIVFTSGKETYLCDSEGVLKWKFIADSNIGSAPSVDKNGNIYFSSSNGTLYCLNSQGKEKWRSMLTGKVYGSSTAMRNDGVIYQLTSSGDLNAIGKIKVKSVSMNTHKVTLLSKGMKGILKLSYSPEDTFDNAMEWSSSNPAVATVKDGVVTPVSTGKALIKVYSRTDNISDTCEVTVVTKPETDMALTCDTVLQQTLSFYQGTFTFQNLTLNDGITLTSEGASEIELIVKGSLNIEKNASIRVRNGYYSFAPTLPISSLTSEKLKKATTLRSACVLSIPYLYGKGGNGGAGGDGSCINAIVRQEGMAVGFFEEQRAAGGGGGGGGFGGGLGGKGGNLFTEFINKTNYAAQLSGMGTAGENDGKNGGNVTDFNKSFQPGREVTLSGGEGGGALNTGNSGATGKSVPDGGSGGGGNGGYGGEGMFGSMISKEAAIGPLGGGGGGGGGYGGGVLVIAAGSINVKPGNIPCFIVSGQMGGKGGYPNGQDGENGEGGLLVIETNSYRPSLSHWNIGTGSIECSNPGINGGHGTVTGNPQKVFINGRDMGSYDDKTIRAFNIRDRSAALIANLDK